MKKVTRPFYPIIYVRGYAMTENEISETVFKDPFGCADINYGMGI